MATISLARARRIALAAQGFADKRPSGPPDVRHLRRVMERMTILQLDSVNVICRSHFLPVLARLGPYDRDKLDRYLYHSDEHFEFLGHEASITSQDLQPLLRFKSDRHWKFLAKLDREQPGYLDAVQEEVAANGPLSVKELSDPGKRTGPWWGMPKGKLALEGLYYNGRLAIHERDRAFVTSYDLPERVLRTDVLDQPTPPADDARKELLLLGARSHGIGTDADLADYFRINVTTARPLLAQLVEEGRLEQVEVKGWKDPAFLHPEARHPRSVPGRALLSPFDPVVWFRPRGERLWDFHYRIEIYVPEPKRVYGYYVLPFLLDEELVGRVDLKADRQAGVLRARGSYTQDGADPVRVAREMAVSLTEMAGWLGLSEVVVEPRGDLAPALTTAVG